MWREMVTSGMWQKWVCLGHVPDACQSVMSHHSMPVTPEVCRHTVPESTGHSSDVQLKYSLSSDNGEAAAVTVDVIALLLDIKQKSVGFANIN